MNLEFLYKDLFSWILKSVDTRNVESFALTILGIGITVFTVLYSFIGSKYEMIREVREKMNEGKASIEDEAQYRIAIRYLNRLIKINRYAIIVSLISFMLFLLCKIKNFFFPENDQFQFLIDLLYIALALFVGMLIVFVLNEYRRLIRQ